MVRDLRVTKKMAFEEIQHESGLLSHDNYKWEPPHITPRTTVPESGL